ncbi:MAG TPA: coenzyme-B sulfoethylthiotransferase subunit gamma, partial [Methanomicrobiales archaeon]|nr:coenzyme-B sulfoethylthiotransferase subunit gamma [Methanomicrobiales archaeon]
MAYKPQFYPGKTSVAQNRKKFMDPAYKMEKLRSLSDDDVVLMLGHRAPGSAYKTIHPPLTEASEPEDPIRKIVEPVPGAKAG